MQENARSRLCQKVPNRSFHYGARGGETAKDKFINRRKIRARRLLTVLKERRKNFREEGSVNRIWRLDTISPLVPM